jgi:uncharacterized protein (DUF924 family)
MDLNFPNGRIPHEDVVSLWFEVTEARWKCDNQPPKKDVRKALSSLYSLKALKKASRWCTTGTILETIIQISRWSGPTTATIGEGAD